MAVQIDVNGRRYPVDLEPERPLLTVLRDELGLTGTKYGCGEGQCGACTVLLGDTMVHACVTPIASATGKRITTIEGLERDGALHSLQQAFITEGAMQCGYCTPGMIMAGVALLRANSSPTTVEIARALEGNVCRCGTYPRVIAAIERAAKGEDVSERGGRRGGQR
jgi:aerobic-type carbon monoxide dehydrogenase small subunit (CoxS/CutS family)